jgi:hypothetical protein
MAPFWNWLAGCSALFLLGFSLLGAQDALGPARRSCSGQQLGAGATVWVVAGQSQASTFRMSRTALPFRWRPVPTASIWVGDKGHGSGRWETYRPGVNSAPHGYWGPEAQLIRRFARDRPGQAVAIIKHGPGETGVAFDPDRRDWNVRSRGEAWDSLAASVDGALTDCQDRVSTVFWMGNNTDAWRADHAGEVERNMTDLIAASRRRWGAEVRWVVGMPSDAAPYADTVREQLRRMAERDPLVTVFDTAGYGTQPDGLHFDAASVVRLGDDFYGGWK